MRVERQPGYVLHQRHYRESSLILEVITQDYGRVALLAKGAKRAKSPYRAFLQPFSLNDLNWFGKSGLLTLTGVESGQSVALKGQSLYCGLYLNELIMRLTRPEDTHDQLFAEYHKALMQLSEQSSVESILRIFEKRLLQSIGYGLLLTEDANTGEPINTDQTYRYQRQHGPVKASNEGLPIRGASLLALNQEVLDKQALLDCKKLMRFILAEYLGEQPLYSRSLFQSSASLKS